MDCLLCGVVRGFSALIWSSVWLYKEDWSEFLWGFCSFCDFPGSLDQMDPGGVPPLSLPPDLEAFKRLIVSSSKRKGGHLISLLRRLTFLRLSFLLKGLADQC